MQMYDRSVIQPGTNTAMQNLGSELVTTLPRIPAPKMSEEIADDDQVVWTRIAAGLTALSHLNCWAASQELTRIVHNRVQPLLSSHQVVRALMSEFAVTEAMDALKNATDAYSRLSYQLGNADVRNWVTLLINAYKEVIRVFWTLSPQNIVDARGLSEYTQRCFALVETCDEMANTAIEHHNVLTWHSCSVVLPAYNEAENIGETVHNCVTALAQICPNFQVIIVNDGSRDATGAIADRATAHDASIKAVHNIQNRGYGGALLAGFAAADGERIFFMDSDGQFDIREIATLLRMIESGACQVAIGYRAKRNDPFMRKLNAWGWKLAARSVAGLTGIRDIDCAFKLFPTDALRACKLIAQGASVNVEMLLKFRHMGLQIHQTPVKHMPRTKGSPTGAKPAVILRAFRELFRLRRHMRGWMQARDAATHGTTAITR